MEGKFLIAYVCAMDQMAWKLTRNGQFTVKTACDLLFDASSSVSNSVWKIIWRVLVSQYIQCFIWILIHGKLITNMEIWKWVFHKTGVVPSVGQ